MGSRSGWQLAPVLLALACAEEAVTQSNRPPVLTVPSAHMTVEGSLVELVVTATDPDDDPVTIEVKSLPEGATFTPEQGRFRWTPSASQSGSYAVVFSASDGRFEVEATASVLVVDRNRPPVLDGATDVTVSEGALMEVVVSVTDQDGDEVNVEVLSLPRGAAFSAFTRRVSWRPDYDQAGSYAVTFVATDRATTPLSARATALITVTNYAEDLVVTDFTIEGTLRDGTPHAERTARAEVTLDFSGETDFSPGIVEMKVSNLPTLLDASWQPFAARVVWSLLPGDGAKTVYARFRDYTESISPRVEGHIVLDTAGPSPAWATLVGPSLTRSRAVQLTVFADDPSGLAAEGAVAVSEDPAFPDSQTTFGAPGTLDVTLSSGDAAKLLYVRFRDAVGNDSLATVAVRLDQSPPSGGALEVISPTDNGFTRTPSAVLRLTLPADAALMKLASAPDGESCVPSDLSAAPAQSAAPAATFLLSAGDGDKRVCGQFLDAAGNAGALVEGAIVLDTVAPTNPNFVNVVGGMTRNSSAPATGLLEVTPSTDDLGSVDYHCFGGQHGAAWKSCGSNAALLPAFVLAPNAPNLIGVRARDEAGNVSDGTMLSLVHDSAAPAAPSFALLGSLADGATSGAHSSSAAVVAQVGRSGADAVEMALVQATSCAGAITSASSFQPYAPSTTFVLAGADGAKTVCAALRDAAGNISGIAGAQLTLDTRAPSQPRFSGMPVRTTSTALTVQITAATDNLGTVQYEWIAPGIATWTAVTFPANVTLAANATSRFFVRALDLARNASGEDTVDVLHDAVAPTAPAFSLTGSLADGATSASHSATSAVVAQVGSGAGAVEMALLQAPSCTGAITSSSIWQPHAPSTTFVLAGADGAKTVCAALRDATGNISTITGAAITLDTTPPSQPRFSSLPARTSSTSLSVQINAATDNLGTVRYEWMAPGVTGWTTVTFPANATLAANATSRFRLRALDLARNISGEDLVDVLQDNVAPPAPSIFTPRRYVNDTNTSVTLSGSSNDPSFDHYEVCTVTVAATASCPATCSGYAEQPATFPQPLAANQKTCLYNLARDGAGNPSGVARTEIVSDMIPPISPTMLPAYEPNSFTVRAPYVDVFINEAGSDLPLGGGALPWRGIAYLEVDTGGGFSPLCQQCLNGETYDPCGASCTCTDARRQCRGTALGAIRAPLVPGAANSIRVRAVDLASNTGDGRELQVNTEGEQVLDLRAESGVRLFGTTMAFTAADASVIRIVELGENRRYDTGDATCTVAAGVPYTFKAHPGSAGVLYMSGYHGTIRLLRRGGDGLLCTGDDTDIPIFTSPVFGVIGAAAMSGERIAWAQWPQFGCSPGTLKIYTLEAGSDGVLSTPAGTAAHPDPRLLVDTGLGGSSCPPYFDLISVAPRHLLYRTTFYSFQLVSGTDPAQAGFTTFQFQASWTKGADMSPDGSRLLTQESGGPPDYRLVLKLRLPGADDIYDASDPVIIGPPTLGGLAHLTVEGNHAVGVNENPPPRTVTDWNAGGDAVFGTADDTVRRFDSGSRYGEFAEFSGGLLVRTFSAGPNQGSYPSLTDLTTLRWELARPFDLDKVKSNGAGTALTAAYEALGGGQYGHLNTFRTSLGRETSVSYGFTEKRVLATGRSLLIVEPFNTPGVSVQDAGSDGVFFTLDELPSALADAGTVGSNSPYIFQAWVGEGKALYGLTSSVPPYAYGPYILEPGASGTLRGAARVDASSALCYSIAGGTSGAIGERHAVWSDGFRLCVRSAGADGVFGDGDTTVVLSKYPNQPTVAYQQPQGVIVLSSDRIAFFGDNFTFEGQLQLYVVDAGPDRQFNTADDNPSTADRNAFLLPNGGRRISEYAMAGDKLAYLAAPAPNALQQLFIYNFTTRATARITFHVSPKTSLVLDPSGRALWSDAVFPNRAIFVHEP